jgi:integrase
MNATKNAVLTPDNDGELISVTEEIEATRARARLLIGPEMVSSADLPSLLATQTVLQHGSALGRWQTPRRWRPLAKNSMLDVDMRLRIVALIPDKSLHPLAAESANQPLLDLAVVTLTRYLIVMRMGPAGIGTKGRAASLDPGVIAAAAHGFACTLVALALARWLQAKDKARAASGFLSVVTLDDLDSLSPSRRALVLCEARRMNALHDRGCWEDLPSIGNDQGATTAVAGNAAPANGERKRDSHLPLPDDYVSEMGQRSFWLIESLAPNLLELAQRIQGIWDRTHDGSPVQIVESRRRREVGELLSQWQWRDQEGRTIEKPPFDIKLSSLGKKGRTSAPDAWPPRTLASVLGLLGNVQLAHLFVVSLSTGGRSSETLDLRRGCVQIAVDGRSYANGRTFKLVRRHDGELRDWVLPDLAVTAIEQQSRLVRLVETIGRQKPASRGRSISNPSSDHLWAQVSGGPASDRSMPLRNLDTALRAYANTLGMDERPNGQMLRPHRFRKTVARLAALALTQAPKVLMDVFGHKSIEMTLYYILSDKTLQAEIEQVGRELRIMRAEETVEAIVAAEDAGAAGLKLGGYGGPAALMIDRAIQVQRERAHQRGERWGAGSVRELAEVLTLQGKAWEVVRRGVVCTKFPGSESGPCNKSRGRPEPAHCQSDCSHRLEEAFLRADVEAAVASSVAEYDAALAANDELMQAMWSGQIRAHIGRFEDVRVRWMGHPLVQRAVATGQDADMENAA